MSSIQELIGKIENNTKKSEKTQKSNQKSKKSLQKKTPEEISLVREKFAGKKESSQQSKKGFVKKERSNKRKNSNNSKKSEISEKEKPHKSHKDSQGNHRSKTIKTTKNKKSPIKKRFFVTQVCTSKKSCGEKFGPYVWERLCNDYNQDPECDSFEIQGFRFERSPCQGACKKSANIRIKEEKAENHTQFSYLTPIKASKLIKMIKSGASPENIKRI